MMMNSLVMALVISIGKIAISIISAFAIIYFRFPLKNFFFWMIFITLMLPVEVRILPTYKVVADMGMLILYAGLTLPLIGIRDGQSFCSSVLPDHVFGMSWLKARTAMPAAAVFLGCGCHCQKTSIAAFTRSSLSMAGTSTSGLC